MSTPRYVDLAWMAAELNLPVATLRTYHKRSQRNRRDNHPLPSDLPAPDAPEDVQATGRPRWRVETAQAYVQRKLTHELARRYRETGGRAPSAAERAADQSAAQASMEDPHSSETEESR